MHRVTPIPARPAPPRADSAWRRARRTLFGSAWSGAATVLIALWLLWALPPLADALELSAYRIVQEAVTNVVRHAGATRAHVTIGVDGKTLLLAIADNGRGAALLQREGHYGVRGMQERAESHGGRVEFGGGPEGGLEVRVRLPLQQVSKEQNEKNN